MKLKVKDMDIATGGILIALINQHDARLLDLHAMDRVSVRKGKRKTVAVVDIAESGKAAKKGTVGLFEEVLDIIKAKHGDIVEVHIEKKPESVRWIKEKLNGKELNAKKIYTIVEDIVNNELTDIELSYYVAANYTHGMSHSETVALTKAMIDTGNRLHIKDHIIADKHCVGGVAGNRTTMSLVPIVTAAGIKMPKTSSRAITSPAGTADTMEVLAPVTLPVEKIKKIVNKIGGCIVWGGAVNLAPADDKIITVEHPLSVDPEGQLLASILAKKGSVGSKFVLVDIPLGKETKIRTRKEALRLDRKFVELGKRLGMKIKVVLTDGNQPIGNGIGPALEARDCLYLLMRDKRRPLDLEKKVVMMAGVLFEMTGKSKKGEGVKLAQEILDSGKAYKQMKKIIKAQGGKANIKPAQIKVGSIRHDIKSPKNGILKDLNNNGISKAARVAGAPLDQGAGIYLYKHEGEPVKKGEKIMTVYAHSKEKMKYALDMLNSFKTPTIK